MDYGKIYAPDTASRQRRRRCTGVLPGQTAHLDLFGTQRTKKRPTLGELWPIWRVLRGREANKRWSFWALGLEAQSSASRGASWGVNKTPRQCRVKPLASA
jgi:hypothetical protein